MHSPANAHDELEITTWTSNFARVRGGREYRVSSASSHETLYTGITEWVYLDRRTLKPLAIPTHVAADFDSPGAPLQSYDAPHIEANNDIRHAVERTAEWHELDSMRHVNNAVYVDWLDDAVRATAESAGWSTSEWAERGLHLRGEYYNLNYKQAAVAGDAPQISTHIEGIDGRLCSISQVITTVEGNELLTARCVYGWRAEDGSPTFPPEGWDVSKKSEL
jgi:YbgC/YbaW family acyl-CoA thioester hydrolase